MANPQKENGHIRIANEVVNKFCCYRLSGQEWQVLWVILRKTWGWGKKVDKISHSQFAELTGINRRHIWLIIQGLIEKELVFKTITEKGDSVIVSYGIQKNYDKWRVSPKKVTITEKGDSSITEKGDRVSRKKVTGVSRKKVHTINILKDTNTINIFKDILCDLNLILETTYRHTSLKTQELINARLKEGFTLEDFKIVHRKKFNEWGCNPKMNKFLRPITLYSNKFESYLNQKEGGRNLTPAQIEAAKSMKRLEEKLKNET